MNLLGFRIEFGNIERTTSDAILAADAILLLEIDDSVGVLHDSTVGGAGAQAAGIGTVHALILAHEPTEGSVTGGVLIEPDQIVVIPCQIGHGLVGVIESGFAERITVPL